MKPFQFVEQVPTACGATKPKPTAPSVMVAAQRFQDILLWTAMGNTLVQPDVDMFFIGRKWWLFSFQCCKRIQKTTDN